MREAFDVGLRFSLVVATIGRPSEFRRLLESLQSQTCQSFDVIVVDQSGSPETKQVIGEFADKMSIGHFVSERGLSRARNLGLARARGEIVAFPDDDAWYPASLLQDVDKMFKAMPDVSGFTGRCTDEKGRTSAGGRRFRSGVLNPQNVWKSGVSVSMFMKREVFRAGCEFDVNIGAGAPTPFQAGEETDLLLEAMKRGYLIAYSPQIRVFHAMPPAAHVEGVIERTWLYSLGMGHVLNKQKVRFFWVFWWTTRAILGAAAALLTGQASRARLRAVRALGVFSGWRADGDPSRIRPLSLVKKKLPNSKKLG